MRSTRAIAVAATALLLAGCGEETEEPGAAHGRPVEGDDPITPEAVAAVALEYLPNDTSSRTPKTENGVVGVEFRYGTDGEYDGDVMAVGVSKSRGGADPCKNMDGCESDSVEGGELIIAWQELTFEADPGIVVVTMRRAEEVVSTYYLGDDIVGDPRDQELSIPVDDMVAVVRDQRISLTTSAEVIELGEQLKGL